MADGLKIFINHSRTGSTSTSMFFNDLSLYLKKNGIERSKPKDAKIILCGPSNLYNDLYDGRDKKVIVQRLDGIYYNLDDASKMANNNIIRRIYKQSQGVIFQSQFAKDMVESMFGKTTAKTEIIHNGCDMHDSHIQRYKEKFKHIQELKDNGYKILMAVASWREVKRIDNVVNGFIEYNKRNPKSKLILVGKKSDGIKHGDIITTGKISKKQVMALYQGIDLLINLSFTEACANVCIEALAADKRILATNNNGAIEVLGGNRNINGYIIEEKWDFKPIHYSKMPQLKPDLVADGIEKALNSDYLKVDVSMQTCAAKYIAFMEKLL